MNKSWPNDPRVGCKSAFNLIEFFEKDIYLKDELKNLKVNLKKMKLLKYENCTNKLSIFEKKCITILVFLKN